MNRRVIFFCHLSFCVALLSCNDHWDDFTPVHHESLQEINFAATVVSSQVETRADGSLVNRLETSLFETKDRTYWTLDDEGNVVSNERQYSVGLFGALTGSKTWQDYVDESKLPTADFMFNQKMDISAPSASSGTNLLTYASAETSATTSSTQKQDSLRFWPNMHDGSGNYDKVSFWAYYPYNQTSDPGDYGISITTASTGVGNGKGMGTIGFTMHPDASEQNDFMLSDLMADCSRDQYPLIADGTPKPVPLRFHHMLAQVRLYAFIRGEDKIVYWKNGGESDLTVKSIEGETVTFSDNSTKTVAAACQSFIDQWGMEKTLAVDDRVPDDTWWLYDGGTVAEKQTAAEAATKCVRWNRAIEKKHFDTSLYNQGDKVTGIDGYYRAQTTLQMSFNNIHTKCAYTPHVVYNSDGTYTTSLTQRGVDYIDQGTLGSATVNHYIQNPYWFYFDENNNRVMLNPTYMYDYFEQTHAYSGTKNPDDPYEEDWSTKFGEGIGGVKGNYLNYHLTEENLVPDDYRKPDNGTYHFNYAPGNIILAVPQEMSDNDVPHIVITSTGKQVRYKWDTTNNKWTQEDVGKTSAKVTINMLNMKLKWEPGFIYCYAFVDDLKPGDDKVRGPESITVVFDPSKHTDQW